MLNKNSARAFQRAIDQGSTPPPSSSKWGIKMQRGVVFWTTSTIKDEKSANRGIKVAKFHYIKTVSGNVVEHSIAFRVASIYWQGDDPFPLKSWLQLTCPLLSMVSYGRFRTHNSRTDRHRIFKLGGEVDHVTRHV